MSADDRGKQLTADGWCRAEKEPAAAEEVVAPVEDEAPAAVAEEAPAADVEPEPPKEPEKVSSGFGIAKG